MNVNPWLITKTRSSGVSFILSDKAACKAAIQEEGERVVIGSTVSKPLVVIDKIFMAGFQ